VQFFLEGISLLILFAAAAFFSAVETALLSLSRSRTKMLVNQNPSKAKPLQVWLDDPNRLLSTLLIGINVIAVASSTVSALVAAKIASNSSYISPAVAGSISGIIVAATMIIFVEVTPKIYAIHNAENVVLKSIRILYVLYRIVTPVTVISTRIGSGIVKLFGGEAEDELPLVSRDEIRALVKLGNEEGVIKEEESQLLSNIFKISEKTIKDIMLPIEKAVMIDLDAGLNEISRLAAEEGYTRMPAFKGARDNIKGVIYSKEILTVWLNKKLFLITDLLRPVYSISEDRKAADVLTEFKKNKVHMALVVNKDSKLTGLVTLEDILEEIVGEMNDKFWTKS